MSTRNINLTGSLNEFVTELIDSGAYQNASEVVRHGLRLLKERHEEQAAKVSALREAAQLGEADFAAGRHEIVSDIGAWLDGVESEIQYEAKGRNRTRRGVSE